MSKLFPPSFFQLLILCCISFVSANLTAQKSFLQSGPMLGYTDKMETMLWVQTNAPAKVQIAYWVKDSLGAKMTTNSKMTSKEEGYTAHLVADQVSPGKTYQYELRINDIPVQFTYPTEFLTQSLWQWRTDPPAFRVALGSCSYVNDPAYDRPGKPYGSGYQIFNTIHRMRPEVMLWLGDNMYLREADWFTRTGFLHRYTHTRSLPELQPLLASTHHYAIWDDHDYGPNDSDRSFIFKNMSREIFRLFWANPVYGIPGNGGITSYFQWADMDFFLLDNRTFRNPNDRTTGEQVLLGEKQMEWLIDALVKSNAPFKLVAIGGQVLNTFAGYETYVNLCPKERNYLLKRIEEENIKNVVFLTGDRHHTELSRMENSNGSMVYDLTVSPLTSGTHDSDERNLLREEGTLVTERNFGILEFSGPRKERSMTMRIYNTDGKELWSRTIQSEQ